MKLLFKRILIFLSPVFIIIALCEYGLSTITNSYSLKRAQLEAQAGQIEVLVLGPSYSLRGIDPAYFSMKGYNAANVAQSLYYDTHITLKYLDKMSSLKIVLIDVSYLTLWLQLHNSKSAWRDYFYADYWGIRYPEIKWYDLNIYSKILQYGNDLSLEYALKGFKVNLTEGYLSNGFAAKDVNSKNAGAPTNAGGNVENMRRVGYQSIGQQHLDSNISYLRNLVRELKKRKITPVFFSPPVTNSYFENLNKTKLKTMDSVMSVLSGEYHCQYFNYTSDKRFTDDNFRNPSHLNESGAIKFSKIINNEILTHYVPDN